jgi:hypothetical protein
MLRNSLRVKWSCSYCRLNLWLLNCGNEITYLKRIKDTLQNKIENKMHLDDK